MKDLKKMKEFTENSLQKFYIVWLRISKARWVKKLLGKQEGLNSDTQNSHKARQGSMHLQYSYSEMGRGVRRIPRS